MQAEFVEAAERQVADQEGGELVATWRVHVAIGVALLDVAHVQRVVLLGEGRAPLEYFEVAVAFDDALLLAVGLERGDRNARGDAGSAVLAVGAVEMFAATPEADLGKRGIKLGVHGLARIEEQRGGLFLGQVAAWMRLCGVELEAGQFGHVSTPAETLWQVYARPGESACERQSSAGC
ncbi:hypothetical protein D3C80_1365150 [compost metagenome]